MSTRFTILLVATLAVSAPAAAQDFVPAYTPDFQGSMAMNTTIGNQLERDSRRGSTGSSASRPSAAGAGSAARASVPTTYRASPAVTDRVKRQFVEFVSKTVNASAADEMKAVLDGGDPVQSWAGIVRSDGLRPGDTADAMAAYWVLNWMIANGGDNNRTQTLAVRDQVRTVIASSPQFTALDNAQRQEMAEALMLNFLTQHAAYGGAVQANDEDLRRRLSDAAVARFRNEMGVDLRRLRLTDQGFVPGA